MRKYLFHAMTVACAAAFNFGVGTVNFATCKEFAILELGWCKGQEHLYDCPKSRLLGGLANGSVFIGATIGAFLIGYVCKLGRRKSLLSLHLYSFVGGAAAASAQCFTQLFLGRAIFGIAIGLSGMVPMFVSEVAPSKHRGLYCNMYSIFLTFGQLVTGLFQLLPAKVVDDNTVLTRIDVFTWRFSQFIPSIVSLIAFAALFFGFTYDTPQELIQAGKKQQAREVIEKLHGPDAVDEVYNEIDADLEVAKSIPNMTLAEAFRNKSHRRVIILLAILSAFQQLTGIGVFISNAARLFITVMGRSFTSTVVASMSVVISFSSTVVLTVFIDKFGRRTWMLLGLAISVASILVPCIVKPIGGDENWSNILSAVSTLCFIPGFCIGMGSIFWVHLAEAFPSEYKNSATSFVVVVNWVCASLIVSTSDLLLSFSEILTYSILFSFIVANFFFVLVFFKESRGIPIGKAYYQ